MQNCLGIYIENNLIKYAKVSKEKESYKIDAFGIEICDNIETGIEKIVEETSSYKVPISMNLMNEKYVYFDVFSLLSKKDITKTIETEFESFCESFNFNKKAFETKYALVQNIVDENKIKVIDVLANTIDLDKQKKYLDKYLAAGITPIGTCITNIAKLDSDQNAIIVNMEEKTFFTTIYNGQVYAVDVLENGSKEVLDKIKLEENSYSKAYEICKQTTLYTSDSMTDLIDQPDLENIVPTLYVIIQKLIAMVQETPRKINKIYLTGTLANINNIDLYFQEFLVDAECKILKPSIVEEKKTEINIKDYIEANSAIALALQGLNVGMQHLNFKVSEKMGIIRQAFLKKPKDNKKEKQKENKKEKLNIKISFDSFKLALDKTEVIILRSIVYLILSIIIFSVFSTLLAKQIENKKQQISDLISTEKKQIEKINQEEITLQAKNNKYVSLTAEIKSINNKISNIYEMKNAIPNLLNQIMYIMPLDAQIVSIENTEDKHIKIIAQSKNYDSLGYLISKIKVDNYLNNIVTSKSQKVDQIVQITIEGELP